MIILKHLFIINVKYLYYCIILILKNVVKNIVKIMIKIMIILKHIITIIYYIKYKNHNI
jgi:hypothetical protein